MEWLKLKALLIERGSVRVTGEPVAKRYIGYATAGPGTGGQGSIFLKIGQRRVRLSLSTTSPLTIGHEGDGQVTLSIDEKVIKGELEDVALHCPRQAYVTLSERCIYSCRYCAVPLQKGRIKTVDELEDRVISVKNRIDGIAITSGVAESVESEERRTIALVRRLRPLDLPIGVSIYPTTKTAGKLYELGVSEVKFNTETATSALFGVMCPGLDWNSMQAALDQSVELFGKNHVFSNVIVGLGETDEDLERCITDLSNRGVIPVLRPLNPIASLADWQRPSAARLLELYRYEELALKRAGLSTRMATTMCIACTGCDLVPGKDT